MAGIVVLCQAQMQQNSPDCQAPSLEQCLALHGMHWPATGGLTPPPAAKDTSCHMGDFLAETVISHRENCLGACNVFENNDCGQHAISEVAAQTAGKQAPPRQL